MTPKRPSDTAKQKKGQLVLYLSDWHNALYGTCMQCRSQKNMNNQKLPSVKLLKIPFIILDIGI